MPKTLFVVAILAFFLAADAVAVTDITITSLTADKTTLRSGEDVTLVTRVRNNGPDAAKDVNLNFSNTYGEPMYVLSAVPAPGWQCSTTFLTCWTESMPANAEATLTTRIVAPATVRPGAFSISVFAGMQSLDGNFENNTATLPLTLQASSNVADLSISVSTPPNPIPQNTPLTLAYDVRNNGPHDLSDVRVVVFIPVPGTRVYEGAGWSCTPNDVFGSTCQRASLGANANAPLSVRFTTPSANVEVATQADAFAVQAHLDENLSNNRVFRTLSIGSAADWRRILIPFTLPQTPGANGSLWKSEVSGVFESTTQPETVPQGCGPVEDPCSLPPLNTLFDAFDEDLAIGVSDGPHFLYVARVDASKVKLATRVYDASKSDTTAGAFVPMARDEDFSPDGFSLIAIPVAPQFRSTLRIYDSTGTNGRDVELAIYGDSESEPFLRTTVRLENRHEDFKFTTALLPAFPASAQLDLSSLIPPSYARVRLTVRASDPASAPAMKLWGFASITNNQTSHVTVVAP